MNMTQQNQNTTESTTETRKGLRGTLLRTLGRDERGTAAIEFALIIPFLLLMFSGILQFGSVMFLESHMNNVAREASRQVAVGALDEDDAEEMVQNALVNWGVTYQITVTTVEDEDDDDNEDITVAISLPMSEAAIIDVLGLFDTGNLSTSVTMRMES
jgi:Flp pilus assembly protein TadG